MLGILPEHTMFTRTPDTFTTGQEIFFLDCRFDDQKPKLTKYFVVNKYILPDGGLMVMATTSNKESAAVLASLKHHEEHIDVKHRRWTHYYSLSKNMASFSVVNPFFLTRDEVVILAKIGKSGEGVDGLLKFFSPDEAGTYSVEQNFKITNWVYYWKTHNTII